MRSSVSCMSAGRLVCLLSGLAFLGLDCLLGLSFPLLCVVMCEYVRVCVYVRGVQCSVALRLPALLRGSILRGCVLRCFNFLQLSRAAVRLFVSRKLPLPFFLLLIAFDRLYFGFLRAK